MSWPPRTCVHACSHPSSSRSSLVNPTAAQAANLLYPNLKTLPPRELRFDRADITPDCRGDFHNVLRFSNTATTPATGRSDPRPDQPEHRSGPVDQRVYDDSTAATPTTRVEQQHVLARGAPPLPLRQLGRVPAVDEVDVRRVGRQRPHRRQPRSTRAPRPRAASPTRSTSPRSPAAVYPGPYGARRLPDRRQDNGIHMGLSVGWGDTYDWYRQQWIDLGQNTLGSGTYVLRSVADPLNIVYESPSKADSSRESVTDNEAITTFVVSGGTIVDSDAPDRNGLDQPRRHDHRRTRRERRRPRPRRRERRRASSGCRTTAPPSRRSATRRAARHRTTVSWNLTDPTYGGNTSTGAQDRVRAGAGQQRQVGTDLHRHDRVRVEPARRPRRRRPRPYGERSWATTRRATGASARRRARSAADSVGSNPGTYRTA